MKENKITVIINKPISEVFQFTTNPKNTHLWAHFISEEVSNEYPPKIGTIYKSRRKNGNWSKMKVVKFKDNKEFTLSNLDEKLFVKYIYRSLDNNKTEIEYSDWMINKKFKSPVTRDILDNLKKLMEKQHIFNEPATETFNKVGISGKIFSSSRTSSESGFVLIETSKGHETIIIEHKCNFVYYILKGNGHFFIEDNKYDCKTGDLVTIPPGTKFTYKGKLKMLLVTTPPFYPEQEETVAEY